MHVEVKEELQGFKLIQRDPASEIKMVNHGGSPPNLGLKEATPELGETRFNQDTFNQHHNNKN